MTIHEKIAAMAGILGVEVDHMIMPVKIANNDCLAHNEMIVFRALVAVDPMIDFGY